MGGEAFSPRDPPRGNITRSRVSHPDKAVTAARTIKVLPCPMEGALRGFLLGKGVDDAEADGGWKKSDMVLLGKVSTALHLKKIDELEEVNRKRAMMSAIEDRALVLDADAEQAIEFRRSWIAQWSGNYGSFDDISEFSISLLGFAFDSV